MTMKAAREPGTGREPSMSQKPQPDSRERLAEALRDEKSLNVCARHPTGTVYFDGPDGACPACAALKDFLALTDDMK